MAIDTGSAWSQQRQAAIAAPGVWLWIWLVAAAAFLLCWTYAASLAPWAVEVPKPWQVPLAGGSAPS